MHALSSGMRLLGLLALVQALALAVVVRADASSAEGTGSGGVASSLVLFALIIAATALMLMLIRWGLSAYLYRFSRYGGIFAVTWFLMALVSRNGSAALAVAAAATVSTAICTSPAARVATSILISTGVAVMMGLFFGPAALIGLMALLSAYDYIAVRKTGHMVQLAEDVMEKDGPQMIELGPPGERMVVGLADLIFPSALVVSAYVFSSPLTALFCAAFSHIGFAAMLHGMGKDGVPALPYGSLGIVGYLMGIAVGA
jgi:presenilin-like A22 family membrane protease